MLRTILKSKLHGARITEANLYYEGSITIDEELMKGADIVENERVQVVNMNNGARFDTYVIKGDPASGVICLNGPAARLGTVGDVVHILSYAVMDELEYKRFVPHIVQLGDGNRIVGKK